MLTYKEAFKKAITTTDQFKELAKEDGYVNVFLVRTWGGRSTEPESVIKIGRMFYNINDNYEPYRFIDMELFLDSRRGKYRNYETEYNGVKIEHRYFGIDAGVDDSEYPIDHPLFFTSEKDATDYLIYLKSPEYEKICIEVSLVDAMKNFDIKFKEEKEKLMAKHNEEHVQQLWDDQAAQIEKLYTLKLSEQEEYGVNNSRYPTRPYIEISGDTIFILIFAALAAIIVIVTYLLIY